MFSFSPLEENVFGTISVLVSLQMTSCSIFISHPSI
ncbi:hypothetical protein BAZSYMA_ACONTIG41858_7 [Bathymodiolus azoricus thioautotrophic gill symbiont]|uniref:Uncharacterized protein n=1 Tax=Bathymodiolus azoricus thioautotrophic gill symbiont TaxID=235205 RepID=A0A1H6M7W2_9GAMM|nr:hypothetical protein BAZSYMA_ACONTIG41858_7 [Bathymodiolus azoricus thioautotrophic gill symbiont]